MIQMHLPPRPLLFGAGVIRNSSLATGLDGEPIVTIGIVTHNLAFCGAITMNRLWTAAFLVGLSTSPTWAADTERSKKPAEDPEVEREVSDLLQRFDTNKDGKISKDEAKGKLAENFDRFDRNKDGFLDKDELRRVAAFMIAQRGRPGGPAGVQSADFDDLDHNADGRLTREELKGTPYLEHFDEIDTHKDGKIDKKEFQAYLKKESEKIAAK